jgi:hypothetical protein
MTRTLRRRFEWTAGLLIPLTCGAIFGLALLLIAGAALCDVIDLRR